MSTGCLHVSGDATMSSPMDPARSRDCVEGGLALLLFSGALALYTATLAPTVTLIDSGELISAAALLDIAHPPGTPLHTLIGRLFAALPVGSVAWRVNFMSAFFGAVTVALVLLLARRACRGKGFLVPVATAAAFAGSSAHWSFSTITEVYTLNTAVVVLVLLLVFRCSDAIASGAIQPGRPEALWTHAYPVGFAFGLGLTAHYVTVAYLVPGLTYFFFIKNREIFLRKRVFFTALVVSSSALLVYLYLPIRAAQKPPFNWGDPSTLERFFWHVQAKQYAVSVFSGDSATVLGRCLLMARLWSSELTVAGAILSLAGLAAAWRRDRTFFWLTTTVLALNLLIAAVYDLGDDSEAYFLPSFVLAALCIARALEDLLDVAHRLGPLPTRLAQFFVVWLPVAVIAGHYGKRDRSRDFIGELYVRNALANVDRDGVVVLQDWDLCSASLYVQHVTDVRPDVAVVAEGLCRLPWYLDYLRRRHPSLIAPVESEARAFVEIADAFAHGEPFSMAAGNQAFRVLMKGLVREAIRTRPVYVDHFVGRYIREGYVVCPRGVLCELRKERPPAPLPETPLDFRGFLTDRVSLDLSETRVRRKYTLATIARGTYFQQHEKHDEAIACFRRSIELEPTSVARFYLSESLSATGRAEEARRVLYEKGPLDPELQDFEAELRVRLAR